MLDPEIAALMGESAAMPALTAEIIPLLRAGMAAAGAALPSAELTEVRDCDADGVPVRLYRPTSDAPLPLLVFLHGGGWLFGDLDTHDAMHRILAKRSGCAVLAVGYRLAPEYPFPSGLEDCATAFAWARREAGALGCDAARVALGGESAGANFTASLTLRLRDAGKTQPLFQLLIHPVTDLGFNFPSMDEVKVPGLSRDYLEGARALYAGATDHLDPAISPLRAQRHDGLAQAIVLTAGEDPLRDDGEAYAATLSRAGVEVLLSRLAGLPHGFLFLPATIPAVSASFDLIARLVSRYFTAGHEPAEGMRQ
jgi:acetyl esterase